MARPDPKVLLDAATTLRANAATARNEVAQELQRRDTDLGIRHDRAVRLQDAADQSVKSADATRQQEHRDAREMRASADAERKEAADAEQKGDTRGAEEKREIAQRMDARAEAHEARAVQADRDYDAARVELAQRQGEVNTLEQQTRDMNGASNAAEKQLDALEEKARLLDEAGRKLLGAGATDNVLDQAQLELDAEKLLKTANGITLDVAGIATFTGKPVALPDLATRPIDTADAGTPADPQADAVATGAPGGDPQPSDDPGALADEFDQASTADPAATTTPAALDASAATGAGTTDAATTATADAGTTATATTGAGADGDASGTAAAAPTFDDPLGTDTMPASFDATPSEPQPAGDTLATVGAPATDTSDASFAAPADPVSDPVAEAGALAAPDDSFGDLADAEAPADDPTIDDTT
jgi:hypothetical protein